ncbi:concanavalin A-like lectin/glucanase [Chloropicon primus]|uniref:Concanavalin A-like lectin/glucanase n=1 Tax=Chloropicon primus TaxID=1764295 RepID=A0A5B8MFH5_9CHLO|nr:concanavalin A-like lectin/glucanase [Chloropicon primus]UPQ98335.1 concanavalin A-like lectin/glucanase [Chloropicon primus]|eukprot:QDZ19127.1 concanavalin A-like lectin/glucanase [Chloropicon primus]
MGKHHQGRRSKAAWRVGVASVFLFLVYALSLLLNAPLFSFSSRSSRRRYASEESGAFWSKHFFYSQNVAWEDYALSLFLEYADRNVTREQVAILSSLVDENRDGRVTLQENASFLIKFGSGGDGKSKMLRAVVHALQFAEGESGQSAALSPSSPGSPPASFSTGCAVKLESLRKEYAEVAASGNLQFRGDSPFTIEVWVKPVTGENHLAIVSKYNRGKWGQYFLKLVPSGGVFFHREVAPWGQESDHELPLHVFSHVAAVYGGKEAKIYLNGTLVKSQAEGAQDNNNETPVLFGAMYEKGAPIDFFDGELDEIRFWDVERTPEQIHSTMHLRLSGTEEGLVAYWPFDECTGIKARDHVGNHDAVLHGGSWSQPGVRVKAYKDVFGCVDSLCTK